MPRRDNLLGPLRGVLILVSSALVLAGCTTPNRTVEMTELGKPICAYGQGCNALGDDPDPQTLMVVSASGGGSRAAALLLGTLRAMDDIKVKEGHTLLDDVDILSSVSGGSVTAAALGAFGKPGLDHADRWLHNTDMSDIVLRYLDPRSSIGNWFPGRAQIDVLVDMLSQEQFLGARTFAQMESRPYVVLNAADMGAGAVFSFTQPTFDLICSDLKAFPIAEAVAGSAAYPFGFGALTIRNHSYPNCDAIDKAPAGLWPPSDTLPDTYTDPTNYDEVNTVRRQGRKKSYFYNPGTECSLDGASQNLPQCKEWIHLLDGGIADNLGISAPLQMLVDLNAQPSFVEAIAKGPIQRLTFVVVNARGEKDYGLEANSESPGWIPQIIAVTGSPIDATSSLLLANLEAQLKRSLLPVIESVGGLSEEQAKARLDEIKVTIVPVDFDFVPVNCDGSGSSPDTDECDATDAAGIEAQKTALKRLRRYMKSISTNWWLSDDDLSLVQDIAKCFIGRSEFQVVLSPDPDKGGRGCFLKMAQRVPADFN